MAHHPIPDPEAAEPVSPREARPTETRRWTGGIDSPSFATDLADLAAKFSSEKGGNLPAQLSTDLALEVVLNEIVEQACRLTGASGAAVILERNQEWVCRATSGTGAPELGARLEHDSGLTAECINSGQAQRCFDTETDATVDVQACRSLGVRSIIMVPIVHDEKLIGVFAAFSPRVSAFGEEDERKLNMLSGYVTSSLALAVAALPLADLSTRKKPVLADDALEEGSTEAPANITMPNWSGVVDPGAQFEAQERGLPAGPHRVVKIATWTLTAVVVSFAIFLTIVAAQRWLGSASAVHRSAARSVPAVSTGGATAIKDARADETAKSGSPVGVLPGAVAPAGSSQVLNPQSKEGGLTVYENGKEIFRMPPAKGGSGRIGNDGSNVSASALDEAGTYELPPEAAEGSLLYRVEPDYPEAARQQKIEGTVLLEVWARPDGSVRSVKLLRGDRSLSEAAIAAVKQWKFKPHLIEGQPTEMRTQVILNFRLPAM